ncbi:MAG: DUF1905 domain-containing protein [Cyclobacteriaceae bacterium]
MTNKVNDFYLLERFPGKGGWTYAAIPEIAQNKNNPFGWVTVSGSIDDHELDKVKLMPMGDGRLFLPVKAKIRRSIGKHAGDQVRIVLRVDITPQYITDEVIECLKLEPTATLTAFYNMPEFNKKFWLDHIYQASSDEIKSERIIKLIDELQGK